MSMWNRRLLQRACRAERNRDHPARTDGRHALIEFVMTGRFDRVAEWLE
jgi:hypothetical protein